MNYSTTQVPFILAALIAVIFNAVVVEPMSPEKHAVQHLTNKVTPVHEVKIEYAIEKEIGRLAKKQP